MRKIILIPILFCTLFSFNPSKAYSSQAQIDASFMIISACMFYQMGQIPRSQIMSYAQEAYETKHGDPLVVNWSEATTLADKIDKKENLGCLN
tara:strand:- start:733 stop:1011 length:279 start_codon:yes stop_codon:yes gene_type:complete